MRRAPSSCEFLCSRYDANDREARMRLLIRALREHEARDYLEIVNGAIPGLPAAHRSPEQIPSVPCS